MTASPTSVLDLLPGDQMFAPVDGAASPIIGLGQFLLAPWKHRLTWSTWKHVQHTATVVQAADPANSASPRIAQAMPKGYEEVELTAQHWTAEHVYLRPKWLHNGQGDEVARHAREMVTRKVPYSFVDYVAIAAHRIFFFPVPRLDAWIGRNDADGYPKRSICSQGNDVALTKSGGLIVGEDGQGHVFADGRAAHDVVPAELYLQILSLPGTLVIKPGVFRVRSTGGLDSLPRSLR